jgi:CheY-like chemotaxis protein
VRTDRVVVFQSTLSDVENLLQIIKQIRKTSTSSWQALLALFCHDLSAFPWYYFTGGLPPDEVVMDISMPLMDGIEATKEICGQCPDTRVMMFSMFDNPKYIYRSLEVGAFGYVLKDATGNDVVATIRALKKGNRYFSQHIAGIAKQYIYHEGNDTSAG